MTSRILVLRPGAIGDTLLAAPALVALRERFPESVLHVVGNERALPVLAAMGLADAWTSFDLPSVTRLFMDATPPPDDPFTRSDVAVAWCADPDGALTRSLRRRGAEWPVIAPSRPAPDKRVHVARHLLRTLAPLGVPVDDGPLRVPPIMALEEMRRQAAADLACAGIVGPYAVVHPGSGSPAKNWLPERFAEVIERLTADYGLPTLLLAGPAEGEIVARLQTRLARAAPVLTDRPLVVLAEILRGARLFLGNDSGLSHLAGLVGAPSLVLFGPSDPALWTPLGDRVRVLRHQPLDELATDQVMQALRTLL